MRRRDESDAARCAGPQSCHNLVLRTPSMNWRSEWLLSLRGTPQGAPCTQTGTDIEFDVYSSGTNHTVAYSGRHGPVALLQLP